MIRSIISFCIVLLAAGSVVDLVLLLKAYWEVLLNPRPIGKRTSVAELCTPLLQIT